MGSQLELTNKGNEEIYDYSSSIYVENKEVDDQSPIEEVALTVPTTDDSELPVLTFRVWVLGILACGLMSFLNQFVAYRENPINITAVSAQIAVLPAGRFMAATLPRKKFRFPGTNWHFSLNPGPFNAKEHVLITIFASVGTSGVYALHILTMMKAFYGRNMNLVAAWLLALTTQMLGFGWAGIFRKFLVESSYMWWPATLIQVSIFRSIWQQAKAALVDQRTDVHTRLMKANYKSVPQYWFFILLALTMTLALGACEGYNNELQLKYWGLFLACGIAFIFTLPIGIIQATTNQQPGLNVITEYIIGYIYPGRPVANMAFKTYGYISMVQALSFVQDFKVGHYMKIPPRSMFVVQVVGTLVATFVYFGTVWWLLDSIENICHPKLLPP